jgi:hypothetical protein
MAAPTLFERAALALLDQILALVLGQATTDRTIAKEHAPFSIEGSVIIIDQAVNLGPSSLPAIQAAITALSAQVTALGTAVGLDFTTAIAAITTNVKASPAPAWYTPPPSRFTADEVWRAIDVNSGQDFGDLLSDAAFAQINAQSAGTGRPLFDRAPWYVVEQTFASRAPSPHSAVPLISFSTIIQSDATPLAWLNRAYPGHFVTDGGAGCPTFNGTDGNIYFIPWLTTERFLEIRASMVPLAVTPEPPVWPGIAKVTLGTPHALATGVTITAPMDGVIVAITAVPPGTGVYDFDGILSYTFVGALSFVSDHADQEFPQNIGFQSAVYSPREMVRASGVKVRAKLGVVGTVTPWTIT